MQPVPPGRSLSPYVPDQNVIIGPWTLEQRQLAVRRLLEYLAEEVKPGGKTHALLQAK